jgi:hypothetical protein
VANRSGVKMQRHRIWSNDLCVGKKGDFAGETYYLVIWCPVKKLAMRGIWFQRRVVQKRCNQCEAIVSAEPMHPDWAKSEPISAGKQERLESART